MIADTPAAAVGDWRADAILDHASSRHPRTRLRTIALLGCGTVGREVAARLLESGERLGVRLTRILVRNLTRDRSLPRELFTTHADDILSSQPDAIIELLGGLDPSAALVERALSRGIPVVTANKTLIAYRGHDLARASAASGAPLAYEASVCAAVPVLASLRHLSGDRVLSIRGIVNGTCNFILSRLAEGRPFADALAEAQRRGLAEPNPSADLSGRDSAEKLCVLAAASGHPGITPDRVAQSGIERLTPDDVTAARRAGFSIKLLAELDLGSTADAEPRPRLRVGPTLIPRAHALSAVEDEENAVTITTALGGDLFLRGRGAGPGPTASAILGDILRVLSMPPRSGPSDLGAPDQTAPLLHPAIADPAASFPNRRHLIRITTPDLTPSSVLETLRHHAIEPTDLSLSRGSARIFTPSLSTPQAAACAHELSSRRADRALVMPII